MTALCRHCGGANVNRPRGLCWTCYYFPGRREQYPSTSKYSRRGVGNGVFEAKPPPWATDAIPGSPEKVAVLEERARLRVALWHPCDAPMCLEGSRFLAPGRTRRPREEGLKTLVEC